MPAVLEQAGKLSLIFHGAGISAREPREGGIGWGCDENIRKCLSRSFSSVGLVIHSSRQRFRPTARSRQAAAAVAGFDGIHISLSQPGLSLGG